MPAEQQHIHESSLAVHTDQPLIGIVLVEDGQEVVHLFVDEADADAAVAEHSWSVARTLAGAWNDLDWDETVDELDRIRHESVATPSIDDL